MKLVLAEPKYLKDSINIISELVNDVKIKIDSNKFEIVAMDPANVAMVIFRLLSSVFIEYELKGEKVIGINLDRFKQILRRAKPSDTIVIELDEEKNKLKIILKAETERSFNLSLLELDDKVQKIPDLKFNAKMDMNTLIFDEAIEDMDVISDSVTFFADKNGLVVQASGNTSDAKVRLNPESSTVNGESKSKYSIEYLKKIIKGSKLTDKVTLQFSKDYPLMVDYKIIDRLQFCTILAPRVSQD